MKTSKFTASKITEIYIGHIAEDVHSTGNFIQKTNFFTETKWQNKYLQLPATPSYNMF